MSESEREKVNANNNGTTITAIYFDIARELRKKKHRPTTEISARFELLSMMYENYA